ncbi:hypothetical protein LCGC14_1049530 [marine sediment metagenome]|uniref:Uncharacterized protein n=1 Tax=marine sediment metagenome TaxID=412755 RepID=A0A0F9MPA8_9ZZZZ
MAKGGHVLEIIGTVHGQWNHVVGVEILGWEFLLADQAGIIISFETLDSILTFTRISATIEIIVIGAEALRVEWLATILY